MSETKGWATISPDGGVIEAATAVEPSQMLHKFSDALQGKHPGADMITPENLRRCGYTLQPVRISTRMECAWPMDHHYWAWSCNGRHRFCASTLPDYCPDCGAPVRLDDSDG